MHTFIATATIVVHLPDGYNSMIQLPYYEYGVEADADGGVIETADYVARSHYRRLADEMVKDDDATVDLHVSIEEL